jgi:Tfp pilus assembly protein PilF
MSRMATKVRNITNAPARQAAGKVPPADRIGRRWNWIWLFLGAFGLAFVAFAPALWGGFVFDDYHLPFADRNAGQMPARFWIGGVRPVLIATYWANFLLSGRNPFSYHLVNLILHAGTAVLVFFIFERLLDLSGMKDGRRPYALFGAALYLLHPLQTESVDYIAGRSELMAGFFFFAAWLVFLRAFESETRFTTAIQVLLLAAAAVLSKESAISLPAILIVTDLCWAKRSPSAQLRRRLKLYVPCVLGAVAGAVLVLRSLSAGTSAGADAGTSAFSYALTQCRVILIYLRLFLIPAGQNGDWQLPFFHSPWTDGAGFYVLAILAFFAAIVWLGKRDRLAAFGLLVFILMLAPTSSFVPIKDALAERRMYAPIAGLILALLALAVRLRLSGSRLRTVAIVILSGCVWLSWDRSEVWVNDVVFWRDSAEKNPANTRAYFGEGAAMLQRHDCAAAVRPLETARSREPSDKTVLWDLASAYQCNKQPDLALPIYRSLAVTQPSAETFDRIGYLEGTLGHVSAALDAIESALRLDPNNAAAYAYRGLAKIALSETAGAQADLRHALELDPRNDVAAKGLAAIDGRR